MEILLLQQLQHALRHLIGLSQHGLSGLDQDVVLGVGHHLIGDVGIADVGLGILDVLGHDAQVVDGVLQTVLHGAQSATGGGDGLDGGVDDRDSTLRHGLAGNADAIDGGGRYCAIDGNLAQVGTIEDTDRNSNLVCHGIRLTDLEGNGASGKHIGAVEVTGAADTVNFGPEGDELFLQAGTVVLIIGAVGGLGGQLHHTVQHVMDLGESTFSGLHHGNTVLGVLGRHGQAGDLGTHLLRNRQTGGVVAGAVDLVAGGQLLQVLGQGAGVVVVVAVGVHRHNVMLDSHNSLAPSNKFLFRRAVGSSSGTGVMCRLFHLLCAQQIKQLARDYFNRLAKTGRNQIKTL